jgi:hypothetical protein
MEPALTQTKKKIGGAVMNAVFEELMECSTLVLIKAVL